MLYIFSSVWPSFLRENINHLINTGVDRSTPKCPVLLVYGGCFGILRVL